MAISIILAHPDKYSFNHAIARTVTETLQANNYEFVFHDLYAEGFPPVLSAAEISRDAVLPPLIEQHCREIRTAEGIIIIHPNWWGQPPAILKGWVDRVLRAGVAYEFIGEDKGEGVPAGLLQAHIALIFNTSNTPVEREMKVFGDPLETLWKNCIFGLCGVNHVYRENFGVMVTSSREQRAEWLRRVREITGERFPGGTLS